MSNSLNDLGNIFQNILKNSNLSPGSSEKDLLLLSKFERDEIKAILIELDKADKDARNLPSCVNSLKKIIKFLDHPNPLIQKICAVVLIKIIVRASEFITEETNPKSVLKNGKALMEIIKDIADNPTIKKDSALSGKLKKATEKIVLAMIKASLQETDEFCPNLGNGKRNDLASINPLKNNRNEPHKNWFSLNGNLKTSSIGVF